MSPEKQVYHVCGSPTSRFFYDLSLIYARETFVPAGWNEKFIVVEPNGKWRTGDSLSRLSKNREPQAVIAEMSKDSIVVPHLFCYKGMTEYRNFFENILGYKLIGSSGDVMATAADKNLCRKKVQKQGVPDGIWVQCPACLQPLYQPDYELNKMVCPLCGNHGYWSARQRLESFFDRDTFKEIGKRVKSRDHLKHPFVDNLKMQRSQVHYIF